MTYDKFFSYSSVKSSVNVMFDVLQLVHINNYIIYGVVRLHTIPVKTFGTYMKYYLRAERIAYYFLYLGTIAYALYLTCLLNYVALLSIFANLFYKMFMIYFVSLFLMNINYFSIIYF